MGRERLEHEAPPADPVTLGEMAGAAGKDEATRTSSAVARPGGLLLPIAPPSGSSSDPTSLPLL